MNVILAYSGGMDSTTLLYWLKYKGYTVQTLGFDYGQKHNKEIDIATQLSQQVGIDHNVVSLTALKEAFGNNALTGECAVPHGHYEDETMRSTVVPNRNMIMLAVVTAYAISHNSQYVAYACHAGDHAIYPDCRVSFVRAMSVVLGVCNWQPITLLTPFITFDKTKVCKIAQELNVPISQTWSCYQGGEKHCGLCATCVERKEAFKLAQVEDLTEYEA